MSSEQTETGQFVVHKHNASQLHYDFRLSLQSTLKSWAVPKGPSLNPKDKRLAIQVADHPLSYADFEGTISEGQYGAGEVIVWDTGTYSSLKDTQSVVSMYERGKLELWLNGQKLCGGFVLLRMQQQDQWLLIKRNDASADRERDIVTEQPKSVLSGRAITDMQKTSHDAL